MKNIKKQLGGKIRAIRLKRAMSQEDLAFEADLHRTYISDVERGSRNISIENIEKIAKALKVKPKNLLDFDE
jgi:transcriptional regulator with XRE-family HTH domain